MEELHPFNYPTEELKQLNALDATNTAWNEAKEIYLKLNEMTDAEILDYVPNLIEKTNIIMKELHPFTSPL
jgi:hypothetical protein